jgi:ParB/RepB/Spo0J family partition protein
MSFAKAKAQEKKKKQQQTKVTDLSAFMLSDSKSPDSADPKHLLVAKPPSYFYVTKQVRTEFTDHELNELAASMVKNGQIQPIVVYPADDKGNHQIDKGERRWRAAKLIPDFKLSAIIDSEAPQRDSKERIVGQVVENAQRLELKPLEMAQALQQLVSEGMKIKDIAIAIGWITKSDTPQINRVSRTLSILKMPEEGLKLVKDSIITDLISLELLRKINDISPELFVGLCNVATQEDGLSRHRLDLEYKQCKANEANKHIRSTVSTDVNNPPEVQVEKQADPASVADNNSSNTTQSVKAKNQAVNDSNNDQPVSVYPIINVTWGNGIKGTIMFDEISNDKHQTWVKIDQQNKKVIVKLSELTITNIGS